MFWWTVRHWECAKYVTVVTSRSSGSSFLNRVELQKGCLALGHANLFIPSTLNGSCTNDQTGSIDQEKLHANLQAAMDVYISRVDGSPCGDTVIHLFKGADSSEYQVYRQDYRSSSKVQTRKEKNCGERSQLPLPTFRTFGIFDRGIWCKDFLHSISMC